MRAFLLLGFVLGLGVSATASAQEVVLEPSTKWHLDYAEATCRLGRIFGEGDQKTVLFLTQHEPSRSFSWTVAGKPVARFSEQRGPEVRFGNVPPLKRNREGSSIFGGTLDEYGPALIGSGHREYLPIDEREEVASPALSQLDLADGSQIEWIELVRGNNRTLRLNTGNMKAACAALNECAGNLVTHWGLDLAEQKNRSSRPDWTNRDAVARRLHYPFAALSDGRRARLNMRIMVGADGRPTQCVLTQVTLADAFQEAACQQVMRHARFLPALGADGQPIPSYYSTDIVYKIN